MYYPLNRLIALLLLLLMLSFRAEVVLAKECSRWRTNCKRTSTDPEVRGDWNRMTHRWRHHSGRRGRSAVTMVYNTGVSRSEIHRLVGSLNITRKHHRIGTAPT